MNTTARALRRRPPVWGFGDRLRAVRRDLGITQAEMATKIGVGLKSYSSWESGQAKPANMVERAELLESHHKIGMLLDHGVAIVLRYAHDR